MRYVQIYYRESLPKVPPHPPPTNEIGHLFLHKYLHMWRYFLHTPLVDNRPYPDQRARTGTGPWNIGDYGRRGNQRARVCQPPKSEGQGQGLGT